MTVLFNSPRRCRSAAVAFAVVLAAGLAGVSTAAAALPAPNQYNATPACPVSASAPECGPWMPAGGVDPNSQAKGAYGQCTYWADEKRPDIYANARPSDPLADNWTAWTWLEHAQVEGYPVDGAGTALPANPQVGDIVVYSQAAAGTDTGHVAYVEAVNADGSVTVSEMNHYTSVQGDTYIDPVGTVAGLSFIHQDDAIVPAPTGPTGTTTPPPPSTGTTTPTGTSPSSKAPVKVRMRTTVGRIERHRRTITLDVRITSGKGTITAVARSGHQHHQMKVTRNGDRFVIKGELAPGHWTVTVVYAPERGFTAPKPTVRTTTVPRGAR